MTWFPLAPAPSQAPRIIGKKLKGQTINIAWENSQPLPDEAAIDGYKVSLLFSETASAPPGWLSVHLCVQVLYRKQGHSQGTLYTTSRRHIDLPLPSDGNYVVEVRAYTEGGDGAVAQIQITGNSLHLVHLTVLHMPFREKRSQSLGKKIMFLSQTDLSVISDLMLWALLAAEISLSVGSPLLFVTAKPLPGVEPGCHFSFHTPDWRANFTARD